MILKNKYHSAMEKITVSDEMQVRILKNLEASTYSETSVKEQPRFKWRLSMGFAGSFAVAMLLLLVYLSPWKLQPAPPDGQDTQHQVTVVNPFVQVKNIAELKASLSFDPPLPKKLPNGYELKSISIISGKVVQLDYSDGSYEIGYRTAQGTEDISGDNTSYAVSETTTLGSTSIHLKGSKALFNLATWTQDGFTFSLSFSAGMEKETVLSIISSIV
jgi:hypothetical protein